MKVCIVSHFAYGEISGGNTGHVGGVERQTSLMARWLAARGHRVSLLTWDEGQAEEVNIDGVRVIKMCRRDAGLPGLRFLHPRWTSLNRALRRADAELYYQNCAEYVTGQIALWGRRHGRRFVYSVASDPDCDPRLPEMRTLRGRVLYRYGLRRADRVVVQTRNQQHMLLDGFALDSTVLPMPCPGPLESEYQPPPAPEMGKCGVIWVGRIAKVKRLELLLDIAEALPEVNFVVAGSPSNMDDGYACDLLTRSQRLQNVTMHGMVPPDRLSDLYKNASIFCCTSIYEGFPNTFLEAWSYGIPIVSTFDPDNLIATQKLGFTAVDRDSLAAGIRQLIESQSLWNIMSANARQYYLDNHAVDPVMSRFEKLFLEVLNGNSRQNAESQK